ncbi:MAG: hypothetical protein HZC28_02310 [Spirochaetes bacterium]|nr:hypothetical protein [Spirochaetota bacterium]
MKITVMTAGILMCLLSCVSVDNKYMIKSMQEYSAVTGKLNGEWNIVEYREGRRARMPSPYKAARISFDFDNGIMTAQFDADDIFIANRILNWKPALPDVNVSLYRKQVLATWSVSGNGKYILFENQRVDIIIDGKGRDFGAFYVNEKDEFEGRKTITNQVWMYDAWGMFPSMHAPIRRSEMVENEFVNVPKLLSDSYTYVFSGGTNTRLVLVGNENTIVLVRANAPVRK